MIQVRIVIHFLFQHIIADSTDEFILSARRSVWTVEEYPEDAIIINAVTVPSSRITDAQSQSL